MTTKKRDYKEGSVYFDSVRGNYSAILTVGYDSRTGKRIRKRCRAATKREALEKLAELKEKYSSISYVEADSMTVAVWFDKWYKTYMEPRIRESSKNSYINILAFVKKYLGGILLSKLTTTDIQTVILVELRDKYKKAQNVRTVMKAALKRAVRDHLIKENPAEFIDLPPKPAKKKFAKPTREAWLALMNAEAPYYFWKMIILMEYMTGLRRSELLGLRWQDIDFRYDDKKQLTGACLHVRHALIIGTRTEESRSHRLYLSKTKTENSCRDLMLPLLFCHELLRYRKEQLKLRMKALNWSDQDFVFCDTEGNPVHPNSFSSYFYIIRRRLGIKTTFHMLRHDMACRMKQSKRFDMKDIQAQLGHSTIQITMDIYTHIDDADKNEVSCWLADDAAGLLNQLEEEEIIVKK